MELIGKNIAILVDIAYQEMEVWYPFYRFQEAGAECVLVAAEAGKVYLSKVGYPATAQLSYDAVSADDFDGVVVDRNLVTSRKPEDLPAFCRASINVLVESPVLTA